MNQSTNITGDRPPSTIPCGIHIPSVITNAILVVAYVTLLIAACAENTIVIYLVRTYKDLKQSTFNYLIINMAVADLIDVCFATLLSLPFVFVGPKWIHGLVGKISCKLVYYVLVMSIGISISTLVIMSVDRYLAIVHTVKKPMSSTMTKRCIAASWLISAVAASPYLYKMDTRKISVETTVCIGIWSEDQLKNLFYFRLDETVKVLLFYALPLIVIATTNFIIGYSLRKRQPVGLSQTQERIKLQNQKIYRLLVATVALFAFCWLFTHVNHLMSVFFMVEYCSLPAPVPLFFFWISHINSAINPVIYFIFNTKFQQGFKEALLGRVRRQVSPQMRNVNARENPVCESREFLNFAANKNNEQRDKDMVFDTKL